MPQFFTLYILCYSHVKKRRLTEDQPLVKATDQGGLWLEAQIQDYLDSEAGLLPVLRFSVSHPFWYFGFFYPLLDPKYWLPRWFSGKEFACQCRRSKVRSLGGEDPLEKEMANLLQYSCLGNPMGRGAWWATVRGVARVRGNLVTKPPPLRV